MDSQNPDPPFSPAQLATSFLGTPPTWPPAGGNSPGAIQHPGRFEPEEHDLSDWFPTDGGASGASPTALLAQARALVEAYRALTWLVDTWQPSRRAIALRFTASVASAFLSGLTLPGVEAAAGVLTMLTADGPVAQLAAAAALAGRGLAQSNFAARQALRTAQDGWPTDVAIAALPCMAASPAPPPVPVQQPVYAMQPPAPPQAPAPAPVPPAGATIPPQPKGYGYDTVFPVRGIMPSDLTAAARPGRFATHVVEPAL
eukprot:g3937.t1